MVDAVCVDAVCVVAVCVVAVCVDAVCVVAVCVDAVCVDAVCVDAVCVVAVCVDAGVCWCSVCCCSVCWCSVCCCSVCWCSVCCCRCVSQRWQRGGNASNSCTVLSLLGASCSFMGSLSAGPVAEWVTSDLCIITIQGHLFVPRFHLTTHKNINIRWKWLIRVYHVCQVCESSASSSLVFWSPPWRRIMTV